MAKKSGNSGNVPKVDTSQTSSSSNNNSKDGKKIPSISLGGQTNNSTSKSEQTGNQNSNSNQNVVAGPWSVISKAAEATGNGTSGKISLNDLSNVLNGEDYQKAMQGLQTAGQISNAVSGAAAAVSASEASKKAPMTKEEEIAEQQKEQQEDTRTKLQKFADKINQIGIKLGQLMEAAAALGSTAVNTYKDIKSDVDAIKNKVNTIKNTVKDIKNGQNAVQALINNPMDSGSILQIGNDAFSAVNTALDFVSDDFLSSELMPNKWQEKLSQKEIQRKIKEAQEKMEKYKKEVEDYIKKKTAAATEWVFNAKASVEDAIAKQTKRAVNAVASFTGMDPEALEGILEQAEAMALSAAMAKLQGKSYDISTQLDILKDMAANAGKQHLLIMASNIQQKIAAGGSFELTDVVPGLEMFQKKTGENAETSATGVPKIDVSSIVNEAVGAVGTSKPKITIDNPLNSSSTSSTGNSSLIGVGNNTYSTANSTTSTTVDAHAAVNNKMENMKKDISRIVLGQ